MQETVAQAQEAYTRALETDGPREKASKQLEITKKAFEKALKDMHDVAEIASSSNTEAMNVINHRVTESLEEIQAIISEQNIPGATKKKSSTK